MKITKKKLLLLLDEKNLELGEYSTSFQHYYYLYFKGQKYLSKYHLPNKFYTLKEIFDFLISKNAVEEMNKVLLSA